jgi:hypothetical protein
MSVPAVDPSTTRTLAPQGNCVEITAERLVDAGPEAVFPFLSDLENHWVLAHRFVELLKLELRGGLGDGGTVRLRGPLGLRRTARTRVLVVSHGHLVGTANIGRRTQATLEWTVSPCGRGSTVSLSATVQSLSLPDRLLLAGGGTRWLRGCFAATLDRLADHVALENARLVHPAAHVSRRRMGASTHERDAGATRSWAHGDCPLTHSCAPSTS